MNLINEIDNFLLSEENRKRTSHYPSDIMACSRQLYLKWIEIPKSNPMNAGAIWKMKIGTAIHEQIHIWLKGAGFDIADEMKFQKRFANMKYPLSGAIDNVFLKNGIFYGVEIKTSYGAGIKQIQINETPKPEHLAQVICYLELVPEIKKFFLLYVGRDNGYRTQFIVEKADRTEKIKIIPASGNVYTQEYNFRQDYLNKLINLEVAVDRGEIPARSFIVAIKNGEIKDKFQLDKQEYKTDWQCSYCQWRDDCWQEIIDKYKTGNNAEMFHQEEQDDTEN